MSTGTIPTTTHKVITVVGAAIVKDGNVLCAQPVTHRASQLHPGVTNL